MYIFPRLWYDVSINQKLSFPGMRGAVFRGPERGICMKTLLKNTRIYDGTGKDAFSGSVLFEDDRILAVGADLSEDGADRILDLGGLSLSPGLIDGHSHNDWFAIKKKPLKYFEPFIRQGMTTFVCGNCGVSEIGFSHDSPHHNQVGAGLFTFEETTGSYADLNEFFSAVDRNMPCNLIELVGHCTARASAGGGHSGKLTETEQTEMLRLLEENLKQGAAGVSLGLMYYPGLYADVEELKKVAALCVKYDKPLTVHPRAESKVSMAYPQLFGRSHLLRAVDELYEIARGTNLKLHYSHAIFVGRKSFADIDELEKIFARMQAEGIQIGYDIYNELLGVSVITVILPAWYQAMTEAQRNKPFTRLKLSIMVKATSKLLGFGFPDIQFAYGGEKLKQYEGMTVSEIAKEKGMSDLDAYLWLCRETGFKGRVNMGPYTTREILQRQMRDPMSNYMSDAWVEDFGTQNPAIYDVYPKFLRDSLTGFGDTMPNTVRKMTGKIADRFGMKDCGYLRPGAYADLTVFDEAELRNGKPDQGKPFGIRKVFISGKLVLDEGKLDTEALKTSGRAIRC